MNPENLNTSTKQKIFTGVVVSKSTDKTAIVHVDRTVLHAKYGKRSVRGKRYPIHDEKNETHIGDIVKFKESRPYSKTKKWRLISKDEKQLI